jgi:hypothetical protein
MVDLLVARTWTTQGNLSLAMGRRSYWTIVNDWSFRCYERGSDGSAIVGTAIDTIADRLDVTGCAVDRIACGERQRPGRQQDRQQSLHRVFPSPEPGNRRSI